MIKRIKSAWSTYGPTDGPGHSDHPRIDIETHRSIARTLKWLGVVAVVATIVVAGRQSEAWIVAGLFFAVAQLAALGLRVEALEWEVQLDNE